MSLPMTDALLLSLFAGGTGQLLRRGWSRPRLPVCRPRVRVARS
jgi:hypothetical protein